MIIIRKDDKQAAVVEDTPLAEDLLLGWGYPLDTEVYTTEFDRVLDAFKDWGVQYELRLSI